MTPPHRVSTKLGEGLMQATADLSRARRPGARAAHLDAEDAVLEFQQAMERYRRSSGRMFPTWSEVLEVLREIGYRKAGA
jgi:hypothetical protein